MREIKFRAWDTELKFFADPAMYFVGFDGSVWFNLGNDKNDDHLIEQTFKLKLIQYTGLKDKNGKEIYEGDRVSSQHFDDHYLEHIVEWSDKYHGWFLRNVNALTENDGSLQLWVMAKNTKFGVIGNIYENPELLPE